MTVLYSKSLRSMLLGATLVVNSTAMAQWGNNAPPCSNGSCAPRAPWGYNATCWRRWPGAMYPDMVVPTQPANRGPGGIQPDNIELPPSTGEADVRPPSPTRQPQYSPTPRPGLEDGFREPAPLDQPFQTPEPGVRDAIPSPHSSAVPMHSQPVGTPAESAPATTGEPSSDTTTLHRSAPSQANSRASQLGAAQTELSRQGEMRIDLGSSQITSTPEVIVPERTSQSVLTNAMPEEANSENVPLQLASASAEIDLGSEDRDNPYPANSLQRRLRANSIRAKSKVAAKTSSQPIETTSEPEVASPAALEQPTTTAPTLLNPQTTAPAMETAPLTDESNRTLESSRRNPMRSNETVAAAHLESSKGAAPDTSMPTLSTLPAYRTTPSANPGSGKSSLPESNPLRGSPVKPASFQLPEQPTWRPATESRQTPASATSSFPSNPLR